MMIKHFSLFGFLIFTLLSTRSLVAFDQGDKALYELVRGKSFEYSGARVGSSAKKIYKNITVKIAFHEPDILDENNPRIIPGLVEVEFYLNSMRQISSSKCNGPTTFYFKEQFRTGLWAVEFQGKDELWHKTAQYFGLKKMTIKMPKVIAMRYSVAPTGNELVLIFGVGIMEIVRLREVKK